MPPDLGPTFFVSGGTLPPDAPSYVERNADRVMFESILRGRFCYVLNSRQMGKSSLSVYAIGRLRDFGIQTAFLDLTRNGGKSMTPEQWYTGIAVELARELEKEVEVLSYWKRNASLGPMQRLFGVIRNVLLEPWDEDYPQLVIFIDEIDATRNLSFDTDEFFAGIRECYNRRVTDSRFNGLVFCLLGVAVPSDLIHNPAMTPFNIGERIFVEDFTKQEIQSFAKGLGPHGAEIVERVYHWTGGHPFLSQSICRSLAAQGTADVDDVVQREYFDYRARDSNVNLTDVANIALHYEDVHGDPDRFRADLLSVYRHILGGKPVPDDESNRVAVVLKLSGLVKADGRRLTVRNRIYRHVFDQAWIEEQMPDQESRRQRQSYRVGVFRTALGASAVIVTLGAMAAYSWKKRGEANEARAKLNYQLYVSDMNSLRLYQNSSDTSRMASILKRHARSPYRGFEWGYWLGRLHDAKEEYTLDYQAPGKREEGHVSANGKEVCIVDALTQTATLVERGSGRLIATRRLQSADKVVPLKNRWVIVRAFGPRFNVLDFQTEKLLYVLGDVGNSTLGVANQDHTDLFVTTEAKANADKATTLNMWDAATGTRLYRLTREGLDINWMAFSGSLNTIVYSTVLPSGGSGIKVLDWPTGNKRQSLDMAGAYRLLALSWNGDWALVSDAQQRVGRFALAERRFSPWELDTNGIPNSAVSLRNGSVIATSYPNGTGMLSNSAGTVALSTKSNVFSLAPSANENEYLASSTSVRFYPVADAGPSLIVAKGYRVTRYADGVINVFRYGPDTIERRREDDFSLLGTLPPPPEGWRDHTYNGHWSLVTGKDGERNQLTEAEARASAITLPFAPAIWASGPGAKYVAIWRSDKGLQVISGGAAKWNLPRQSQMDAMWISPDESRLIIVRDGVTVVAYDLPSGRVVGVSEIHNAGPVNVSFAADRKRFFTCGGDGRAALWTLAGMEKIAEFDGNSLDPITSADLSPDGRRVVTTGQSGTWQLWDAANGVQLMETPCSNQKLSSALFTADGRRIVTAGDDGQVRVWISIDRDPTVYIPVDEAALGRIRNQVKESNTHGR